MSEPLLPFNPEHLHIVLVQPQHSGNIGATCRAMKNMGLRRLRLVAPATDDLELARWMAVSASDMLNEMEVFDRLEDALSDISTVVGTTARERHWRIPVLGARNLGAYLLPRAAENKVAIVFGREDFGLPNEVTGQCEVLVKIPTVDLESLNLAQAVLIVAYELMMSRYPDPSDQPRALASVPHRTRLVDALIVLANRVEYQKDRNQDQVRSLLHGIVGRASLDGQEINNILGFINKVQHHLDFVGVPPTEQAAVKGKSPRGVCARE